MAAAYRGASVILFAPIAAMLAVVLTDPGLALPMFSGVFMERMVGFIKLYFPVFLLGAIFGKLMEIFRRWTPHAWWPTSGHSLTGTLPERTLGSGCDSRTAPEWVCVHRPTPAQH